MTTLWVGFTFLIIFTKFAVSQDDSVVCSNLTEDDLFEGRYVTYLQDNYYKIRNSSECCEKCSTATKPKCHFWQYHPQKNHCVTFGKNAQYLDKPPEGWKRITDEPGCDSLDVCSAFDIDENDTCSPVDGAENRTISAGETCNVRCTDINDPTCCGVDCFGGSFLGDDNLVCGEDLTWSCSACVCLCFAASSTTRVLKDDGSVVVTRLDELKIGDKILSVDDDGNLIYSVMYHEPHALPVSGANDIGKLLRLTYDGGEVQIAPAHMIYLSGDSLPPPVDHCIRYKSQDICVYNAFVAKVGDTVWVTEEVNNGTLEIVPKTLLRITKTMAKFRTPQTLNGNIVVDNVVSSVFVHLHDGLHAVNTIFRVIYYIYSPLLLNDVFLDIWMNKLKFLRLALYDAAKIDAFVPYAALVVYTCSLVFILTCLKLLHVAVSGMFKKIVSF